MKGFGFVLLFFGDLLPSLHCFSIQTCQFFILYIYFFHVLHRLTLEIMTLQPKCDDVETAEGVAITVTGVAQVNHYTLLGMPLKTRLLTHTHTHCSPLFCQAAVTAGE